MAVLLVATLDTKGEEIAWARDRLAARGVDARVVDAGCLGEPVGGARADIPRAAVFEAARVDLDAARARGDRGEAVAAAARGVAAIARELADRGELEGILAIGGSAGTTIGTAAMRAAPFGIPKVMVSTMASGQTRPYVGGADIAMFASVADVAGLNRITRTVLTNAAEAMAGMVTARRSAAEACPDDSGGATRPLVTASMFGVTTPCVERARRILERAGCEVIVFHATGTGGRAMEGLARDGLVAGSLDLTTTELADELVGGVLTAGPDRLRAAVAAGVPQVVGVGALDMVNFGPRDSVPEKFAGRLFHVHNPTVTLMRTTPEENARLGARIAEAVSAARAPTVVALPLRGVSALDAPGKPFHDPVADAALFEAIRAGLAAAANPFVKLVERDEHINDPPFAEAAARELLESMGLDPETGADG